MKQFGQEWLFGGEWADETAPVPTITVTNGVVSTFTRGGIDYTQIRYNNSGSMSVSGDVAGANRALIGGGASGGARGGGMSGQGGGGGGDVDAVTDFVLLAGDYTVAIGEGGASASAAIGNDGQVTTLTGPINDNAPGGGGGGSPIDATSSNGRPGGNGGGGAGGAISAPGLAGTGTPGFNGGAGFPASTDVERAGGGGGGAGGAGQAAVLGVAGNGGPGEDIPWMEPPTTAGRGGNGSLGAVGTTSPNETNGNGSNGIYGAASGVGGKGFAVFVIRADRALVVAA